MVYVLATLEPDRSMRYLGLKGFQYALNVVNLILASVGVFLAVRTLRNLKALEVEQAAAAVKKARGSAS